MHTHAHVHTHLHIGAHAHTHAHTGTHARTHARTKELREETVTAADPGDWSRVTRTQPGGETNFYAVSPFELF